MRLIHKRMPKLAPDKVQPFNDAARERIYGRPNRWPGDRWQARKPMDDRLLARTFTVDGIEYTGTDAERLMDADPKSESTRINRIVDAAKEAGVWSGCLTGDDANAFWTEWHATDGQGYPEESDQAGIRTPFCTCPGPCYPHGT